MGFSAMALPCAVVLRGDELLLRQRFEDMKLERLPIARSVEPAETAVRDVNGLMTGLMNGPIDTLR